ncbi:MAG TPA: cbb3-type cytochrome c oxidase subunit 3 [Kofleriaceae bacterium]|jgi:cbb3-type cytochrome oxidase subunit 3
MIRLSELVSALTPTQLTQFALLIFVGVFVAIAIRHGGRKRKSEHEECAQMPLADDVSTSRESAP